MVRGRVAVPGSLLLMAPMLYGVYRCGIAGIAVVRLSLIGNTALIVV